MCVYYLICNLKFIMSIKKLVHTMMYGYYAKRAIIIEYQVLSPYFINSNVNVNFLLREYLININWTIFRLATLCFICFTSCDFLVAYAHTHARPYTIIYVYQFS
ncbi:hypothetical protein PUN28_001964 [Cardiocondyla obscurior]|uniref:Uncharacterized protein n=1 Tax=Cardiocondyla obscurior TaxID=286306 RepID=A0AAW2GS61_9HYME